MTLYNTIYKDKELKKALHVLDFEIIKLNLRGSKHGLSKETSKGNVVDSLTTSNRL